MSAARLRAYFHSNEMSPGLQPPKKILPYEHTNFRHINDGCLGCKLHQYAPCLFHRVSNERMLAIEILASRLLAPHIGVSLYTWTSIIGVVLAGISIGNWLGSKIADKHPVRLTLGIILLASALTTLLALSGMWAAGYVLNMVASFAPVARLMQPVTF